MTASSIYGAIYRFDFEHGNNDRGETELSDRQLIGVRRVQYAAADVDGQLFSRAVALIPLASGAGYQREVDDLGDPDPAGLDLTARVPPYTIGALLTIEAIELYTEEPDGTAVDWRLFNGTDEYWWDGAQWAVVATEATDWNTPTELIANVASWPITEPLGVMCRLRTTDEEVTPVVYGAMVLVHLQLPERWLDELVHRTLVPTLEGVIEVQVFEELPALEAEEDTFSFDPQVRELRHNVVDVLAVYDVDADPAKETPIAGVWDLGTLTWTANSPLPIDARPYFVLQVRPFAGWMAKPRWQRMPLPAIVIDDLQEIEVWRGAEAYVRDLVADPPVAHLVQSTTYVYVATLRIVVDSAWDVAAIKEAVLNGFFGASDSRRLTTPLTAQTIHLTRLIDPGEYAEGADDTIETSIQVQIAGYTQTHGLPRVVNVLKTDGLQVQAVGQIGG